MAKKRQHMILKAVGHFAGVRAGINIEAVRDSIFIQNFVELCGIDSQAVLVTYIDRDRSVSAKTSDVLIHKSERSIGSPFRKNVRLGRSLFRGEVKIKWRILWVGRPRSGRS